MSNITATHGLSKATCTNTQLHKLRQAEYNEAWQNDDLQYTTLLILSLTVIYNKKFSSPR